MGASQHRQRLGQQRSRDQTGQVDAHHPRWRRGLKLDELPRAQSGEQVEQFPPVPNALRRVSRLVAVGELQRRHDLRIGDGRRRGQRKELRWRQEVIQRRHERVQRGAAPG